MLTQNELKTVSRIMEVIDGQSRQLSLVSNEMPTVSSEMMQLIEKTYRNQDIAVSPHQIQTAIETVKKAHTPAQGVDYLLQKSDKSSKRFSITPQPGLLWDMKIQNAPRALRYLMDFGLRHRPYSDQHRSDFMKTQCLTHQFKSRLWLGVGATGMCASLAAMFIMGMGVFSLGAVGSLAAIAFGINHWWKKRDWKKMWERVENGELSAIEWFHYRHVFDFTTWVARSNPSKEAINDFFGGLYVPSSPMVWNEKSKSMLKKISANENARKIMGLWQEEGVAWRQQDFWFFVALGYQTNTLPLGGTLFSS